MASKLITNKEKFLSEVFSNIFPSTKNLYFLVGYFYFSGFEQIYKNIDDKNLKILIGLDIETNIQNKIKEFELIEKVNLSRGKIKNNFYKSMVQLFNDTDFFDLEEKQKAFKIYLEKIRNGSLEIKKTIQPNHAKMYLLENKEGFNQSGEFPGTLITGSSNLSKAGLKDRMEINVILRDSNDYLEGKKIFDDLWAKAVIIVDSTNNEEFFRKVIDKIWIDKLPSPYLLYLRVLDELFSKKKERKIKYPSEITDNRFFNLKYQTDAIQSSISIIEKHGGVIISHVVGLGKSIIASATAYNLGLKTIIIAPPHLNEQWEDYRWSFDYNAKVYGSGSIERALEENSDDEEKLIIIDEAHKYRNENTDSYAKLHQLCQGNKIMLLSATPFNNRPQDIFSMIKLFQIPAKSTIQSVDNLSVQFKQLVIDYKDIQKDQKENKQTPELIKYRIKALANKIRDILFPLLIRRTRLDLDAIDEYKEDLKLQGIKFPRVEDPISLEYVLGELSEIYFDTLEQIAPEDEEKGFLGARYKPVYYLKDFEKYRKKITDEFGDEHLFKQSQINIAKFMRRLLVLRFESSIDSFKKSLNYMIRSSEIVLNWYEKAKMVPIFKRGYIPDVEKLKDSIENDSLNDEFVDQIFENNIEKLKEKGFQFIPSNELKISFKNDVEKDIELLKKIRNSWQNDNFNRDPKLKHFINIAREKLKKEPDRKMIVFTTYADTAQYLFDELKDKLRVFKYSSSDANKKNKEMIKCNFDAGIPENKQRDDYDILIATDAISEGYNLHRAGAIFNYDIPYNPTRVIQRVGRINRVNKKVFDKLFIYNFFPTDIGEQETGVKRIATLKKAMINALLGEDTKVLTCDEELESFFKERFREAFNDQEEESWDTPYIKELGLIKKNSPELLEKARAIPKRVRIQRSIQKDIKGVLVFGKKGNDSVFKLGINNKDIIPFSGNEALINFNAEFTEKSKRVSSSFEEIYNNVKEKLFSRKTQVPYKKGRRDAINKLKILLEKLPEKIDYLEDLITVIERLDALTDYHARFIRSISLNNLDFEFLKLQKAIPHKYIIGIIEKAKKIDEGKEYLILSEEFI